MDLEQKLKALGYEKNDFLVKLSNKNAKLYSKDDKQRTKLEIFVDPTTNKVLTSWIYVPFGRIKTQEELDTYQIALNHLKRDLKELENDIRNIKQ